LYHFGTTDIYIPFPDVEVLIDCTADIDPRPRRDGLRIFAAVPVVALIYPLEPQVFIQKY
jgi:hypothetical protein